MFLVKIVKWKTFINSFQKLSNGLKIHLNLEMFTFIQKMEDQDVLLLLLLILQKTNKKILITQ